MSFAQEFAVSCLSASLAHIPHHPLYTLKSQMMFYGRDFSFFSFMRRTKVTKGTFLFQGLVPRTFGIAPEKALKMQAWVLVGRWVDRHVDKPTITKWLMAGAAAGAATTLIGCPSERAMVLAHIQKKGFMDVIKNTGIRGLYHGFEPTIYRDISFNMAFFTIREIFVRVYRNHYAKDPNPFQRTLMGIISGTLASVVACPFDVVKTRIQGKDLKSASAKQSDWALKLMLDIARREGPRHLMKGLGPRLIAVPSYMSVFYVVNEELEWHLLSKRLTN
jgi:hypothetical protein